MGDGVGSFVAITGVGVGSSVVGHGVKVGCDGCGVGIFIMVGFGVSVGGAVVVVPSPEI